MTTGGHNNMITTTNDTQGRTGMEANGDNREDNNMDRRCEGEGGHEMQLPLFSGGGIL